MLSKLPLKLTTLCGSVTSCTATDHNQVALKLAKNDLEKPQLVCDLLTTVTTIKS